MPAINIVKITPAMRKRILAAVSKAKQDKLAKVKGPK